MTGKMGDNEFVKNIDCAFANKCSALLYYDLTVGEIGEIIGVDEVLKLPGVVGYHQCHKVGDVISGYGTSNNVAMRFIVSCDTKQQNRNERFI